MRFFEVSNTVDAITGAAMVAQTRASAMDKVARLSMDGFLQMLQNAGVVLDYEGFKSVFDSNPQLKNVISKFDKSSITFAAGDVDDEDSYEEPTTDMPDDERVAKMAKRAMRTREAVGDDDLLRPMVNMKGNTLKRYGASLAKKYPHLAKSVKAMMPTESQLEENTGIKIVAALERIVDEKSAAQVNFFDGKAKVDMYTASAFMQVYNKVNDANQKKMAKMIETRPGFISLMKKVFNMISGVKEGHSPHKKGTKKYKAHMAAMHANSAEPKSKMIEGVTRNILYREIGKRLAKGHSIDRIKKYYKDIDAKYPGQIENIVQALKDRNEIPEASMNESEAIKERSLTKAEKAKMRSYEKKLSKADFVDRYGKEGEAIYYGTITKMAKKNA